MSWSAETGTELELQWWKRFNDPLLNSLIEEALTGNKDLAVAAARVEMARAGIGSSYSGLAPAPSVSSARGATWTSRRIDGGPPKGMELSEQVDLFFGAVWELDFWGRYRNTVKSAQAAFLAQESSRNAVWLSVAGLTAKAYFDILSYSYQAAIAEETLFRRREAVALYRANAAVGYSGESDLLRAESEVETAVYALEVARMTVDEAHGRLQVLLGRSPVEVMDAVQDVGAARLDALPEGKIMPYGIPADLLERRPDIRAAEEDLRAAGFDIGVVRAEYFPSISLSGSIGWAANKSKYLTLQGSESWSYQAGVRLPLDFWQTRFREKMAEARARELTAVYEWAVSMAFKDMRDALSRQGRLDGAAKALARRIAYLQKSVAQAEDRYRAGYSGYLELLDAERSLFDSRLLWAQERTAQLHAMVDVCLALGGGWPDADPPTGMHAPGDKEQTPADDRGGGGK